MTRDLSAPQVTSTNIYESNDGWTSASAQWVGDDKRSLNFTFEYGRHVNTDACQHGRLSILTQPRYCTAPGPITGAVAVLGRCWFVLGCD